jgi:hypothetical protein
MRQEINLHFDQAFLETARSVQQISFVSDPKRVGEIPGMTDCDARGALALSLSSISIIYSFLAVENFINCQLHSLWVKSRERSVSTNAKRAPFGPTGTELLDKFYGEFGREDDFERLKNRSEIRELAERIKTVCRYLGLKQIYEVDPALWHNFITLMADSRHFLTHAYPDPELVQRQSDQVLQKNPPETYSDTAASIIRHFYVQKGSTPPTWLDKNEIFRFTCVEFPPKIK